MYRLKIKDSLFKIPKENIGLFAYMKACDIGKTIDPRDKEGAIEFLKSIGMIVEVE